MNEIRVVVAGATGKVGKEIVRAVCTSEDMRLVGAVAKDFEGFDVGGLFWEKEIGVKVVPRLDDVLEEARPHVMVDFTAPNIAGRHMIMAIEKGVHPVVGSTGIPAEEVERARALCRDKGFGAIMVPNFAIGAMLLQKFVKEAAAFFDHVEIVELHHNQKLDAPSGTALRLAGAIPRGRKVPIHSVRLPGLVAHHEVIFGGPGQLLTLRHDTTSREAFVPGVLAAIRRVMSLDRLVQDLQEIIT